MNEPAWPSKIVARGRIPLALALMASFSVLVVGLALVSQYAYGMLPCPWCIVQRVIFLLIALVCGLGWLLSRQSVWPAKASAAVALALAASGVAAAWYQHEVASQLFSCNLTFADRLLNATGLEQAVPFLFQVQASCADGAVDLLGVSYEFWSLAAYVMLGLAAIGVLLSRGR